MTVLLTNKHCYSHIVYIEPNFGKALNLVLNVKQSCFLENHLTGSSSESYWFGFLSLGRCLHVSLSSSGMSRDVCLFWEQQLDSALCSPTSWSCSARVLWLFVQCSRCVSALHRHLYCFMCAHVYVIFLQ